MVYKIRAKYKKTGNMVNASKNTFTTISEAKQYVKDMNPGFSRRFSNIKVVKK